MSWWTRNLGITILPVFLWRKTSQCYTVAFSHPKTKQNKPTKKSGYKWTAKSIKWLSCWKVLVNVAKPWEIKEKDNWICKFIRNKRQEVNYTPDRWHTIAHCYVARKLKILKISMLLFKSSAAFLPCVHLSLQQMWLEEIKERNSGRGLTSKPWFLRPGMS